MAVVDPSVLDEARSLLSQGLSYTRVSQLLGVARSSLYRNINPETKEKQKIAQAKWNEINKDKVSQAQRKWRKQNPRKLNFDQRQRKKEANIRWAKNNPNKVKAINQKSYRKHRAKKLQIVKLWREKNRERVQQRHRAWLKNNIAKTRAINANRRRQKRNAPGPHSIIEKLMVENYYQQAQKLSQSTGVEYHVDHIWPLSKGGPHLPWNLQVITARENLVKHNKI